MTKKKRKRKRERKYFTCSYELKFLKFLYFSDAFLTTYRKAGYFCLDLLFKTFNRFKSFSRDVEKLKLTREPGVIILPSSCRPFGFFIKNKKFVCGQSDRCPWCYFRHLSLFQSRVEKVLNANDVYMLISCADDFLKPSCFKKLEGFHSYVQCRIFKFDGDKSIPVYVNVLFFDRKKFLTIEEFKEKNFDLLVQYTDLKRWEIFNSIDAFLRKNFPMPDWDAIIKSPLFVEVRRANKTKFRSLRQSK
jgi:hypothetical protein